MLTAILLAYVLIGVASNYSRRARTVLLWLMTPLGSALVLGLAIIALWQGW